MSDDTTILQYVQSIDSRLARMESANTTALHIHQQQDDTKHIELDRHINGLKLFRAVSIVLGLVSVGGTGALKADALQSMLQEVLK